MPITPVNTSGWNFVSVPLVRLENVPAADADGAGLDAPARG